MYPEITAISPDHEIVSSRIFHVPAKFLFRAWAEPQHLKEWWGPEGFTNTFHNFDFRVGGNWKFTMHAPVKGNFENECEFTHIEEPSLIAWKRYSKPLFKVVATFEETEKDKTLLTFRQIFDTVEECNKIKPFAVEKNEENFDRLEVELTKMK